MIVLKDYEKLQYLRQRAGILQGDFAQMIGLGRTTMSRIESGHKSIASLGDDRIYKIAEILNVDVSDFMDDDWTASQ